MSDIKYEIKLSLPITEEKIKKLQFVVTNAKRNSATVGVYLPINGIEPSFVEFLENLIK